MRAFKCFLTPSGVDEFPNVDETGSARGIPDARATRPAADGARRGSGAHCCRADGRIARVRDLPRVAPAGGRACGDRDDDRADGVVPDAVHIVHLSSASSLDVIRAARARGLPLTVETCPHYLTFAAEEIPDGATEYKCAPPIRDAAEREALWDALIDGRHRSRRVRPLAVPAGDEGDRRRLLRRRGAASRRCNFAVRGLDRCARARRRTGSRSRMDVRRAGAARRIRRSQAGSLVADRDADIVIWDPDASFVVEPRLNCVIAIASRRTRDASSSESSARRMLEVAASSTIPHSRPLRDHDHCHDPTSPIFPTSRPSASARRSSRRTTSSSRRRKDSSRPDAPEWREGVYTERGKWMDGWETRRRRTPGLRLGDRATRPARDRSRRRHRYEFLHRQLSRAREHRRVRRRRSAVAGVAHGEATSSGGRSSRRSISIGNAPNEFAVDAANARVTHVRLNIFPDGGVARLRVHGDGRARMSGTLIRRARSTSPQRSTAGSSSRAATCTTATARTSFCPGDRRTWATAGRRSAAAAPATTGRSFDWLARGTCRAHRARHRSLQGQCAGCLHARVLRRRRRSAAIGCARRKLEDARCRDSASAARAPRVRRRRSGRRRTFV